MSSSIEALRLEDRGFELQLIENGIPVDSKNIRRIMKCKVLQM
jgi:hypothetical protein